MQGPPSGNSGGAAAYPSSVNPYPTNPNPSGQPSGPQAPATGPGSGFPPRSGLAGLQPNSYAGPPANLAPGAGIRGGLPEEKNVAQLVRENTTVYGRKYQALLDRSTPHVLERWLFTFGLFLLFGLSVILRQGVSVPHLEYHRSGLTLTVVHRVLRPGDLHAQPVPRVSATSFRPFARGRPGRRRGRRGRPRIARL